MHITLSRSNVDRLLKWSHDTNRSVNELVNLIVASVETVDVSEETKITTVVDGTPARRKLHRRQSTWQITT